MVTTGTPMVFTTVMLIRLVVTIVRSLTSWRQTSGLCKRRLIRAARPQTKDSTVLATDLGLARKTVLTSWPKMLMDLAQDTALILFSLFT